LPHADAAMERHACGDDAAFAIVFDAVAPFIARYARRVLGNAAAADDIVQQTLLRMNRARGDFLPGAQVLPWAHAIAHNVIFNHLRQRKREDQLMRRVELAASAAFVAAPDEQLLAEEAQAAMRAIFATMPQAQRDTYLMMRRDGLTLAETARRLKTTVIAVKLRMHRAMARLRSGFNKGGQLP
jgi:RNA polymerase sigma-70 factor, ECF subfamily